MTQTELLDDCRARLESLLDRLPKAVEDLSDEEFNKVAPGGEWSLAGIIDHTLVSLDPYIEAARPLIDQQSGPTPGGQVKNTFFGGMVTKAAGPGGNAPAPKNMYPRKERFDKSLVEDWVKAHQELLELTERARQADMRLKFTNPFVSFLRFNLVDFFTIMVGHAERHVGQIEERRPGVVS